MIIREVLPEEKSTYNKLAVHPMQSWEWGHFREEMGQKVFRFGYFDQERMVKAYQFFLYSIPKLPFQVGYFPKGPTPDTTMITSLQKIGLDNRAIFIKFEPNVIKNDPQEESHLASLGLIPGKSLFTKYTSIIDLSLTEEALLAKMHPKTRYNIKVAQKHGVTIQEDNSNEAFEVFLNLLFETTERQGFYAHNKDYHRRQWQILQPAGISHLLTAKYQGKVLAAFVLFSFNHILYYPYGASSRDNREAMAPTLLMWEAIKFGQNLECESFDLWGETAPEAKSSDPWFGWHRFKQGFGPTVIEFIGTYDLVINPSLYKIYQAADWARWKLLRLKTKLK